MRNPSPRSAGSLAAMLLFGASLVGVAVAPGCSKGAGVDEEEEPSPDGGASKQESGATQFTGLGGLDPACVTAKASTEVRPAYLMFVVDGSNSMAMEGDPPSPSQKWSALKGALESIFDTMATKADPA